MPWIPVSGKHAIERVRVIFSFKEPLPKRFSQRLGEGVAQSLQALGFGLMQPIEGHEFVLGPGNVLPPQPMTTNGWRSLRLGPSGNVVEALILDGTSLVYEIAEYVRWPTFLDRYRSVSQSTIDKISEYAELQAFALEYFDRFIAEGSPVISPPGDLFTGIDGLFPDAMTTEGEMWHLHRGWFERAEARKLLIQQNMDAADGLHLQRPARSVGIVTRAEHRADFGSIEFGATERYLEHMHTRLNGALANVLSAAAKRSIGLEVGNVQHAN